MVFQYKCVLLIGATSGIGAAMADKLVQEGARVIAVGRRQERLDTFVQKHDADRASSIKFDITDKGGVDAFVNGVIEKYPDLDCVFLNSGVQSVFRLSRPEELDLSAFHSEININFTAQVDLSVKFLVHLLKKSYPTAMVFTGTHLSMVPAVTLPAYSASKAALQSFLDCLRRQNQGTNVKFVEIMPPVVQTELHDHMGVERGRSMGMPVAEFTEQAYAELVEGKDQVIIGQPVTVKPGDIQRLLEAREGMFNGLSDLLMSHF